MTKAQKSMIPGLSGGLGRWRGDRIKSAPAGNRGLTHIRVSGRG